MDVNLAGPGLQSAAFAAGNARFWYAVYTRCRAEKRVAEEFQARRMEFYLPLYEAVHQWKDRRARVHLPLFPGYVFVRFGDTERVRVLQVPNVVQIVSNHGRPIPLQPHEVDALLAVSAPGMRPEPHPYLSVGRRVRIKSGPFQGLEGFVKRKNSNFRVVISLDSIMRSMVLDVDEAELEPAREARAHVAGPR